MISGTFDDGEGATMVTTTFTCPKCGRSGSLKKSLPPGATLRCKGCQTSFSPIPSDERYSGGGASDSQIEQFIGRAQPNPLPPNDQDDEATTMGAMMKELAEVKEWKREPIEPPRLPFPSTYAQTQTSAPESKHSRTALIVVAAGALSCLGIVASIFVVRGRESPKIRPGLFDAVIRSAKAIEGNARIGLDRQKFRELLQNLSTELELAKDEIRTDKERDVSKCYDEALSLYQDSMRIWDLSEVRAAMKEGIDAELRELSSLTIRYSFTSDPEETQKIVRQNQRDSRAQAEGWTKALEKGLIPVFRYGSYNKTFLTHSLNVICKQIDGNAVNEVLARYKVEPVSVFGCAFVSPDEIQKIWEMAKKRVTEAKKMASSEV